jgi:hypothetical protein
VILLNDSDCVVSYTVVRSGGMNQNRPFFFPVLLNVVNGGDSCGIFRPTNGHTTRGQDVYVPENVAQVNTPLLHIFVHVVALSCTQCIARVQDRKCPDL